MEQRAKGLCVFCTSPVARGSKSQCVWHLEAAAKRDRKAKGHRAWRPGSRGRKPLSVA